MSMFEALERVKCIFNGWEWRTIYKTNEMMLFAQNFLSDLKIVSESLITRNENASKILTAWVREGSKHPDQILEQLCEVFGVSINKE